jgi:hypothetical protein
MNSGSSRTKKKDKIMKTTILLAVALTSMLTLASSGQAGEPVLSPKAKEHAYSVRKVPAVASDVNLATNRPNGNAKAWEMAQSLKRVPSTGSTIDLAHAPRPTMSPKDPRYETALRENATKTFQVAPLK